MSSRWLCILLLAGLISCAEKAPAPTGNADPKAGVKPTPAATRELPSSAAATPPPTASTPAPETADAASPLAHATAAEDFGLEPITSKRSFADFRPSLHGFKFVNSFTGSPLPIELPAAERKLGLPSAFGLCGGMSAAAADYFLAGRTMPADSTPPQRGTHLYEFLYKRQVTTLAPMGMMGLKFVEWMELPDEGTDGTQARTLAELPAILDALAQGEPVMLGLVLVSRSSGQRADAWQNHQVLAYSALRLPMGVVEVKIYDPNYPQADDAVIRILTSPDVRFTRVVPGRRPTNVRGFFRMPYVGVVPPHEKTG